MATRWYRHIFKDGRCERCGQVLYHDVIRKYWPKNGETCYAAEDVCKFMYYTDSEPRVWELCHRRDEQSEAK